MARLNADEVLPAIIDGLPGKRPRPYGTYGPPVAVPRGVLGKSNSQRHSIEINWWSDNETPREDGGTTVHGNQTVAAYAARAKLILTATPLTITDGTVVSLRWMGDNYVSELENNIRRVQQLYRIDTE